MTRRKQKTFIRGTTAHRRTEGDYMGVLLDIVTLDDWRDSVALETPVTGGSSYDPAAEARRQRALSKLENNPGIRTRSSITWT